MRPAAKRSASGTVILEDGKDSSGAFKYKTELFTLAPGPEPYSLLLYLPDPSTANCIFRYRLIGASSMILSVEPEVVGINGATTRHAAAAATAALALALLALL